MSNVSPKKEISASKLIDGRIKELGDWRGETLARVRELIKQALPDVTEDWKWRGVPVWYSDGMICTKWRGVPVWYSDGMICTGETYKSVVKVTFANGAELDDPSGLFNSSLDGNVRRAIDIAEGEKIKATAFKALIKAAAKRNAMKKK